jgi:hypothetical protein
MLDLFVIRKSGHRRRTKSRNVVCIKYIRTVDNYWHNCGVMCHSLPRTPGKWWYLGISRDEYKDVGFEVLTAVNMKSAVFWVVAPCSLVEVYQRFRGPCCLHHQGDEYKDDVGGSKLMWNVGQTRLHGATYQNTAINLDNDLKYNILYTLWGWFQIRGYTGERTQRYKVKGWNSTFDCMEAARWGITARALDEENSSASWMRTLGGWSVPSLSSSFFWNFPKSPTYLISLIIQPEYLLTLGGNT